MKAVVVYESMFGNTHAVAEAIGKGLGESVATVVPAADASPELLAGADLVVVGGPTHVHGMSRQSTRRAAVDMAAKPDATVVLEPPPARSGVREWLAAQPGAGGARAAAFDTRLHWPAAIGGKASRGIARQLRHHGYRMESGPESFYVSKENRLLAGEEARAEAWGRRLAATARAA